MAISLIAMRSPPSTSLDQIEKKIASARNEARALYNELDKVRNQIQDASLDDMSSPIPSIPKNYNNLKLYNTLRGHQNKVAKIQWSSDSTRVLSASQDGYMIIWDAITGFKKQAISLENQWVLTCSYSPSGKLAASAGLDNACTIYKIKPDTRGNRTEYGGYEMSGNFYQSVQSVFKGHTAYISDCNFVTNNTIITASGDMTCAQWDVTKGGKVRDFIDHLGDVLCISTFPADKLSENLFVSGSSDGHAKIWDLRSPTPAQNFYISNSDVNTLSIFPDGNSFVSGSDDGLIRLFDLRSDCEISNYSLASQFQQHNSPSAAKFNNPPHRTASKNGKSSPIDQFSTKSASIYSTIDNPGVFSLDFSKSGRFVYACYSEFGCMIWDILKNEIVGSIGNDHVNKINQISVSPDGMGVATASWDSTIKIWSA
ncbi:WD40-repeat-containing domain protein [Scheffersomyces xylosifermentans]|uniref:WD40-repeat-containing domain protein n=1 Tax=Scheffersomyces xylosifermentans TaxID=1304137 RepID=UPI00315D9F31